MTITEKILARHAGLDRVRAGDIVQVVPDLVMTNDISGPIAISVFNQMGVEKVWDPNKVVIIIDHFTPNKDISAARTSLLLRNFAARYGISKVFDAGYGIEHVVIPELGLAKPGDLVIGGDSHTVTYGGLGVFSTGVGSSDIAGLLALGETWLKVPETIRIDFKGKLGRWIGGKDLILLVLGRIGVSGALYCTLEFGGEAVREIGIDGRLTLCNMAIEAGAKSGIVEPDDLTWAWMDETVGAQRPVPEVMSQLKSDTDCTYRTTLSFDVTDMEPQVAMPHLPSNVSPVSKICNIKINQVVIGSCTNGRLSDLRVAAEILKGKKVHKNVRVFVIPGSQRVFRQALDEGLIKVFAEAGAILMPPTCGPCFGGHSGILAEGERCVSTTNRNFLGRMGHESSEVYLTGPAVAAASAIAGRIAHPEEV